MQESTDKSREDLTAAEPSGEVSETHAGGAAGDRRLSRPDVRGSFEQQTALFEGAGALFGWSVLSLPEWLEPLSPDWIALDVACGAGHVAQEVAPRVRHHHFPDPAVQLAEMARVCRPGGRVVVSDTVAPSAADRQAFDALHRVIDPSHARCLLDAEMLDLMTTHVGSVTRRTAPGLTYTMPVEAILTVAGQPEAAVAARRAQLAGCPRTGFRQAATGTGITVTFDQAIMASSRET